MDFHTFLKDLCLIELSDMVFVEQDETDPLDIPSAELRTKLLPTVNRCLDQLYIDFQIEQKELVLRTSADITKYYLTVEHALTNVAPADKYIIDNVLEPFIGDLARIDEVRDEHGRLVFSAVDNVMGGKVRQPRWDCLVFQTPLDDKEYLVRFRAKAPVMLEGQADESTYLMLPPGFDSLLRKRIAAAVYGAQKTQDSIIKSQHYESQAAGLEAKLVGQDTVQEGGWDFDDRAALKGFI